MRNRDFEFDLDFMKLQNTNYLQYTSFKLTVIVGFLGCGKTTFIKNICQEFGTQKVAILQNEFSKEMGIEMPQLIKTGADVFELPNGCLCCSTKDGLVVAIEKILEHSTKFDWLLVEAAGTADPIELTGSFWLDYALESPLVLDGVLAITDASILKSIANFKSESHDPNAPAELIHIAATQLSVADVVIINKCDMYPVTTKDMEQLIALNPSAQTIQTNYCKVDIDMVLNLKMFATSRILTLEAERGGGFSHEHEFKSHFIKSRGVYSLTDVNAAISHLLWELPAPIYRFVFPLC
ncbi:bifunctional P-loop containing nucleoside triphosphate hydrolase/CobW-HypB-UreG [Babesia duncani]|uniref:Bifunctional P-loop containing nucleoside triphosphate hydrolase/CobW-HypB-UreG n=1 Tax=Babesia duncani TaxID=323732 RepID=A0AAD9PJI6_9APIC|nr:bifunctional P-loop containing nucleoside triphosphate hydrolase/CobW-HypB-UreG [Babesia duncani]